MRGDRNSQILSTGMKAAKEQMDKHEGRPEYPRDYFKLYNWLEDKLFNLYEAISLKHHVHARRMAGEIIVTSSEVAEFAEKKMIDEYIEKTKKKGEKGNAKQAKIPRN